MIISCIYHSANQTRIQPSTPWKMQHKTSNTGWRKINYSWMTLKQKSYSYAPDFPDCPVQLIIFVSEQPISKSLNTQNISYPSVLISGIMPENHPCNNISKARLWKCTSVLPSSKLHQTIAACPEHCSQNCQSTKEDWSYNTHSEGTSLITHSIQNSIQNTTYNIQSS